MTHNNVEFVKAKSKLNWLVNNIQGVSVLILETAGGGRISRNLKLGESNVSHQVTLFPN